MRKAALRFLCVVLILIFPMTSYASRSCDGTDDEVDMGNSNNVTTADLSICSWVKTTENAAADAIGGKKANAGASAGYLLLQSSADVINCLIHDGTDGVTSVTTTDTDSSWQFPCCTWNASTETTILTLNGAQEDTDTGAGSVDSISNSVEYAICEDANEGNDLTGLVAFQHFYETRILTLAEQNEIMWKPGMITGAAALWGYWALLGDSPEPDYSGNGNSGTVSNATTSPDGPPVMLGSGMPI